MDERWLIGFSSAAPPYPTRSLWSYSETGGNSFGLGVSLSRAVLWGGRSFSGWGSSYFWGMWLQVLVLGGVLGGDGLGKAIQEADTLCRKHGIGVVVAFIRGEGLGPEVFRLVRVGEDTWHIESVDTAGWQYGLWTLLREGYGLYFPHPRLVVRRAQTPTFDTLIGTPRFRWRGFHLHTQHPLELTEALHNPDYPNGLTLIHEYICWLSRNGQNYFEFCLLRTVDFRRWVPYFRQVVSYAQERGVRVGVDLSLRMQQQYAYQLLRRYELRKPIERLRWRMDSLAATGVYALNVELTSAEFVGRSWGSLLDTLAEEADRRGFRLLTRQHVVPPEAYAHGSFQVSQLPPSYTLAVHSVMCYGLRDTLVPVYRCRDFSHLRQSLAVEGQRRPVWYYPESAYWVTFDNSVPVWLLSYLRSRWEDIEETAELAEGHLTFSSGWDVGYWLFDWRIAAWSWRYKTEEGEVPAYPADGFVRLFGGDSLAWARLIRFQDSLLVGRDLLSYITPTTPIDELGWRWLPPFQPRFPHPPWKLWRRPRSYRPQYEEVLAGWRAALGEWPPFLPCEGCDSALRRLHSELSTAWEITRERVAFRYWYLEALLAPNRAHRRAAVRNMEVSYEIARRMVVTMPIRYPETAKRRMCRAGRRGCKHPHPSYRFGYLYPAVSLHFWKREIGQAKHGRWSPFYMNLWNIPRITGLY